MRKRELRRRIEALEKELMWLRSRLWCDVQDYLHPYHPHIPEPQRKYELIAPQNGDVWHYTSVGPATYIPCSTETITFTNSDTDMRWLQHWTVPSTDVGMPWHPAALEV